MAFTVHQSESALDTAGAMTVTLGGGTTNGRYLVVVYGAVLAGQAQAVSGWTEICDIACNAGESGGWIYAAYKPITANENSITLTGVNGTGNQYAALFEVSCSAGQMAGTDFDVSDLSGTGTTIVLDAVDAIDTDLVIALALFHDDDGTSFSFSNSFGNGPAYRETSSGSPQLSAQAAYRIVNSTTSYTTTATVAGPPSADERHGVMIVLHEYQGVFLNADAGAGSTLAASAGANVT